MYKISVPIMNRHVKRSGREKLLEELKRFDAERIFLALDTYETDNEKRTCILKELADNCKFFKDHGFEVGAWIWTFWVKNNVGFRNMRSVSGTEIKQYMCPTDEKFLDGNIPRAKAHTEYVFIQAARKGQPNISTVTMDGRSYRMVEVAGRKYIPDRNEVG